MSDIRTLLKHAAPKAVSLPDLQAVARRARRRRRRRRSTAVAGGLACVVASIGALSAVNPQSGRPQQVTVGQPASTSQSTLSSPFGTEPVTFVGIVGNRVAVVSTRSGQVVRYLTGANGYNSTAGSLSADGTAWYLPPPLQSSPASCTVGPWSEIDLANGTSRTVFPGLQAESLAPDPAGNVVAYEAGVGDPGSTGICLAAGLTLKDNISGTTRQYRQYVAASLHWSPDGRYLVVTQLNGGSHAYILEVAGSAIVGAATVGAPSGCSLVDAQYDPATRNVAIGGNCTDGATAAVGKAVLIHADPTTGDVTSKVTMLSLPHLRQLLSLSVSRTGAVIFSVDGPNSRERGSVYTYNGQTARLVRSDVVQVAWH